MAEGECFLSLDSLTSYFKIIIDAANKEGYDLIIMGSRGLSLFKDLLLGSVSFKVMHHARCAVMVVR